MKMPLDCDELKRKLATIPEEEPDEIDLRMMRKAEAENDEPPDKLSRQP